MMISHSVIDVSTHGSEGDERICLDGEDATLERVFHGAESGRSWNTGSQSVRKTTEPLRGLLLHPACNPPNSRARKSHTAQKLKVSRQPSLLRSKRNTSQHHPSSKRTNAIRERSKLQPTIQIISSHQQLQAQLMRNLHIRYLSCILEFLIEVEILAYFFQHDTTRSFYSYSDFI